MKSTLRRDLGFQLLALYLLFVGPVVLASLVFDHLAAQRLEADVKATDLGLARAIAQETNTAMDSSMEAVRQLAKNPAVIAADPEGMQELFQFLLGVRSDINLIYRLSNDGRMLYHYPTGPGSTVGWDFSFRDYYKLARDTHHALMSKGRISPTTQQPVATAVMPLWADNGDFLGVVATNIKLQSLSHTLASIVAEHHSEDTFEVVIIDSAGQIIAHPSPPLLLNDEAKKPELLTQTVLTGQSGNMILDDSQGEQTLYSYVPIPSAGWGVIVSRPTASAFATPQATHRGVLFLIGFFLAIGLLFWVALSRQVIQPLEHLAAFSQSVGLKKNTSHHERQAVNRLSSRSDQIGHLSRSLMRMEQAIDARLKELSTLLQTSAAVVSTLDSRIVLDRILEQVELLMDINMCTIVALDEQRGMFRAQASRGLSQRYTDQLSINPSEPLSVTLRAIRSGEPVQISDTETDESFAISRPRARAEGYRSILAVPLNTQHAPPSALLVYRPEPHRFSEREINLLTNFANHAAMAIENATLYARSDMRLKEQTRRLEAMIQSLQDGLILENLQGSVLYANRRISELVDLPLEEITGMSVSHLMERLLSRTVAINGKENTNGRSAFEAAMHGNSTRSIELAVRFPRQIRYLRLQVFEVTDAAGMRIGRGQILRDITQNREIDRMKSSLISTVSHELRTPLAAIKGYATTLLAEDVHWDAVTQKEFLEIISSETDRLSNLVNDLLDMSRIEAGSLKVNQVECDLGELIRKAVQTSHPAPGDRLKIDLAEELPPIFADQNRIVSVLRNLIENATKYAGEESPIRVSANRQSDAIVVRVEDVGPGIPAEDSERVFESFYRIENGLSRSTPGAGLGLSISRGFVHAHGGKIWMEPRSQGTCIAFSLPTLKKETSEVAPSEHRLNQGE
jgi:PAS domain S-box-containing protein